MSFNGICENKILTKISEFAVTIGPCSSITIGPWSSSKTGRHKEDPGGNVFDRSVLYLSWWKVIQGQFVQNNFQIDPVRF